jgi:hypothetical protein
MSANFLKCRQTFRRPIGKKEKPDNGPAPRTKKKIGTLDDSGELFQMKRPSQWAHFF